MEIKVPILEIFGKDISASQEASFWSMVDLNLSKTPCWNWIGNAGPTGYGRFKLGKSRFNANRVSYAIAYGHTPADKFVCHSCDNPRCVRPDHLFLGSPKQNTFDMISKKRNAYGSKTGTAILNEQKVKSILSDTRPQSVIAKEYGVDKSTIGKIKSRVNWVHVETEWVGWTK